jgi:hypothetical protein
MANNKVNIIQDWPEPRKVKDIQSFLSNLYRQFIFNYSEITILLTQLTQKGTLWNFNEGCHLAFNSLKKAFTTTLILTHWIPDCLLIFKTNASAYALAAILSMITLDSELHPIVFHSWTFSGAKL